MRARSCAGGSERSARHADERERLVVALDHSLRDLADACDVVLLLRLRLQRAALEGDERPPEAAVGDRHGPAPADDPGLVERLTGRGVLLAVGVAAPRAARHDDPRPPALDAALPRVARAHEAPVAPLERQLAHVPDVVVTILRVVVEGPLDRPAALGDRVAYDGAADAEDPLGPVQHHRVVGLRRPPP